MSYPLDYLKYNTSRNKLIIPEYGRHIQKMVRQVIEIEDCEKRNKMAHAVIGVMGNLTPHLRDVPDFQHKLWDQLFIMSDFQLDVNSPYPKISKEVLSKRPEKLKYPTIEKKYRFYGKNLKKMIEVAKNWQDKDSLQLLYTSVANHMKKSYLNFNKDTVEDHVIFSHLRELSDGKIDIKDGEVTLACSDKLLKLNPPRYFNKKRRPPINNKQRNKKYNG